MARIIVTGTIQDGFKVHTVETVSDEEVGRRIDLPNPTPEELELLLTDEEFAEEWFTALAQAKLRKEAALTESGLC